MPNSKPMSQIGQNCHEVRIYDSQNSINWRIIYKITFDAILALDVFAKKTQKTPDEIITTCKKRLQKYLLTIGS